jgi:hippurate hydrolase
MKRLLLLFLLVSSIRAEVPPAARAAIAQAVDQHFEAVAKLYRELHAAPELSFREEKSAARLAGEMRALGWEVTEKVGRTGVVAVLKNGAGPTVLVRCDMDGLPVLEKTGLPYASKVVTKNDAGLDVPVMHACGHDTHMAAWVAAAKVLSGIREHWKGTLVFIAQPAEEIGGGARAMLEDGLFTRFPKPDFCIALHVSSDLTAGMVGTIEGPTYANVDSVDVTMRGVGGHGAQPQTTKDPVVLAAQFIMAIQTIDSREIHPLEPVVVTVGSIHGGTKHNITPDFVKMQLTVRSFSDETRKKALDAIERIARGVAVTAGLPEGLMPEVKVSDEFTPVVMNDPVLTKRLTELFRSVFGADRVRQRKPTMGGEDFARYGRTPDKIPICIFAVGSIDPDRVKEAEATGVPLPSTHSPYFAPKYEPMLKTAATAFSNAVVELLGK